MWRFQSRPVVESGLAGEADGIGRHSVSSKMAVTARRVLRLTMKGILVRYLAA